MRPFLLLCALACIPLSGQPSARADDVPKEDKGKWISLFQKHADEYTVTLDGNTPKEAHRLPEPLLRWRQPIRGGDDGVVYLWVDRGRPVAAVTFFTFKWPNGKRAIVHERHSFAPVPLHADWRGKEVWRTSEPGVAFKALPNGPTPADSPMARLRQMRQIVGRFSAETRDYEDAIWSQRILDGPLYRFELEGGDLGDGALFVFAQGMDPEAFLLLQAPETEGDPRWEYALARFTDLELTVQLDGVTTFSCPISSGRRDGAYHCVTVLLRPSDDPADFEQP